MASHLDDARADAATREGRSNLFGSGGALALVIAASLIPTLYRLGVFLQYGTFEAVIDIPAFFIAPLCSGVVATVAGRRLRGRVEGNVWGLAAALLHFCLVIPLGLGPALFRGLFGLPWLEGYSLVPALLAVILAVVLRRCVRRRACPGGAPG